MSNSQWRLCIDALIHPKDDDVRRVCSFWFISNPELQKTRVLEYLREYSEKNHLGLEAYIEKIGRDESKYSALISTVRSRIRKSKVSVAEEELIHLTEHDYFSSFGAVCRECTNEKKLSEIPETYNDFQTSAMRFTHTGYKEYRRQDYENPDINNDEINYVIYMAMKSSVKKHLNGRPRTEKKYINECYRRATRIMEKYIDLREADNDAVFNDGKDVVVHDFRDDLLT